MKSFLESLNFSDNLKSKMESLPVKLLEGLDGSSSSIRQMGEHIFSGGGKYIRPAFLLLVSEMLGYKGAEDVDVAAAVEYIHTATLIHDDIIDGAGSRRSRATLHNIWDYNVSILFGDYIYAKAIDIINRTKNHRLNNVCANLTLKVILGEIKESENRYNLSLSYEDYLDIIKNKTGELFADCARIGAILAEADEKTELALYEAGLKIGIVFQFVDDLMDYIQTEEVLGKPTFSDLRDGKLTLPAFLLMDSDSDGRRIVETIINEKGFDSVSQNELSSAVTERKIPSKIQEQVEKMVLEGIEDIRHLPMNFAHRTLEEMMKVFASREK